MAGAERIIGASTLARGANEKIRNASIRSGRERQLLALVCECGQADCQQSIAATPDEYDTMRSDRSHRLVAVGHVRDTECVIIRTGRYWIVKSSALLDSRY